MKKYLQYLAYLIIAALILRPFFVPGFLFLLDMVWGPSIRLSGFLVNGPNASFPITLVLKTLSLAIPTDLLQKLLLGAIFFLAGSAMYAFARSQKIKPKLAFAAGLFYMLNPYVYERFLAGHWLVFLGYAFFPIVLKFFLKLLKHPERKNFFQFALLFALYPIISLHWFYIAFFFFILVGIIDSLISGRIKALLTWPFWKYFLLFAGIFLLINSFWLFSFFGERGVIQKITWDDFGAYQTEADPAFGAVFNVLSLYGFWSKANFLPKDFFDLWWLMTILIIFLSLVGLFKAGKERRLMTLVACLAFGPALFIAVGYANPWTKELVNFLYRFLPGFKGLRETAKVTGLLAFFYAFFLPLGAAFLVETSTGWLSRKSLIIEKNLAWLLACLVPVFITFGIFNSFSNQVAAYAYPSGWAKVEKILGSDPARGTVLFLPWQGYPRLDFAGRIRAANPAKAYFGEPLIAGENLNSVFLEETAQPDWDRLMIRLVQGNTTLDESLDFLKKEGVKYVILAKIDDWNRYEFLEEAKGFKKLYENEGIVLYKML